MRVVHDNRVITFDWQYGRDWFGRYTRCNVVVAEDNKFSTDYYCTTSEAWCNPEDAFVKDVGRKISLTRAIKDFPREVRAKIWEAYLNR